MRKSQRPNPKKNTSWRQSNVELLEMRVLLAAHIAGSSTAYATIQAAVNAAAPGAVINVDAGNYAELVTINKTLTIRGAEAGVDARSSSRSESKETIVTGASTPTGTSAAFYINANDVTLDGLTVQGENNGANQVSGAGIVVAPNISGVHILNNIVQNNVSGMFLANASATDPAVIQHNLFQNNNNNGANGGRGIYTDGSLFGAVIQNVVIDSNTFINNHGGSGTTTAEAAIAFEAQTPGKQSNIRITNNIFQNNGKAVLFFNTTNILFQGNTVTGQTDSAGTVRFEGGDVNVTIDNNTIDNNGGAGIAIDNKGVAYDDSGFTIAYNNIYSNSKDWGDKLSVIANAAAYDGPLNAINNWWGAASGPGGDGPGTGDTIYGNGNYNAGKQWTKSAGGDAIFSPWATTVFAASALPSAPTNFSATAQAPVAPAVNPQIILSWQTTGASQDAFEIDRSTDGVTFSTYAIVAPTATSFTDANVATSTSYYYRIAAIDAAGNSAYTSVAKTTTSPSAMVQLSSLPWVSATAGWGTVQENQSIKDNPLTLRGAVYTTGIGTHAASTIVYNLAGAYTLFVSDVGIDDETGGLGNVDFQVIGDGKVLYDSGVLTGASPVAHINVSVAGVQQLSLVATNGIAGDIDYDHADWAGAELLTMQYVAAPPSAPANLVATPASASQINLTWANTASNQASLMLQRSTDGQNFTSVATIGAGITSYSDTGLTANTQYYYRIVAVNSAGNSVPSVVATATTAAAAPVNLSTLTPISASAGWGTVQTDQSIKGNPLTLRGVVYTSGIGTHAPSTIVYDIGGNYKTFIADVGIDDETAGQGAADFQIYGDGVLLYDSGVVTGTSATQHVSINVAGVQQLSLVVSPGVAGTIDYDHADWAGAQLS